MSYLGKKGENSYESPGIRFLSSSNDIDPLWRSVGHLGKVEVSCSEVLSQFEMLSGLEKFSLDSGDAENDENQEKMGLLKTFFFCSKICSTKAYWRSAAKNAQCFFNFCSFILIPLAVHNCSDPFISNQNFSLVWRIDRLTHSTVKGHKKSMKTIQTRPINKV